MRELLGRRPRRLGEYPEEAAAYELYHDEMDAALRAGEPGDDACERHWAAQEVLLEAQGERHGRRERALFLRSCAAAFASSPCADVDYRRGHQTECEREDAAAEARMNSFHRNLERGDVSEALEMIAPPGSRPPEEEEEPDSIALPGLVLPSRGDPPLGDEPSDDE